MAQPQTETYTVEAVIVGPKPKEVYEAWLDAGYHGSMTGSYSSGKNPKEVGGTFTAWNGFISGKTLEVNPKQKSFRQTWRTQAFKPSDVDSMIDVQLTAVDNGTKVTLKHSQVPAGQGEIYKNGWTEKYFVPMGKWWDKTTFESHVHPTAPGFEKITDNLWTMETAFPGVFGAIGRSMTVYKMKNGKLWLFSLVAMYPKQMAELEAFGEIAYLVCPTQTHRADLGVYKKRYPKAQLVSPPGKGTVKLVDEICQHDATADQLEKQWAEQGVHILYFDKVYKEGPAYEQGYFLDLPDNKAAFVCPETVHHHRETERHLAPQGPGLFLIGNDLMVPKALTLPGVGFLDNTQALQTQMLQICDKYDPRLSTFCGKSLEVLTVVHGPPVHKNSPVYKDALWALRYKVALGPVLPVNKYGGLPNTPKQDIIKIGYLHKTGPDGKKWDKRYCELTKDGRLVYYKEKDSECKGFVDLHSQLASPVTTPGKLFTFTISRPGSPDDRVYKFHAESDEDVKDWVNKINTAASSWYGSSTVSYTKPPKSKVPVDPNEDPIVTQILEYWFQGMDEKTSITGKHASFWFTRNAVVDQYITAAFGSVLDKAIAGGCDSWLKTQRGTVALIILLDQFTRNIYRDTPKMFSGDAKALEIVEGLLKTKADKAYPGHYCIFIYLCLSRHEDVSKLEKYVEVHKELYERIKDPFYAQGIKIAETQLGILQQFKRFPVRNNILGRKSTDKEIAFLKSAKTFST